MMNLVVFAYAAELRGTKHQHPTEPSKWNLVPPASSILSQYALKPTASNGNSNIMKPFFHSSGEETVSCKRVNGRLNVNPRYNLSASAWRRRVVLCHCYSSIWLCLQASRSPTLRR